MGNRTMEAKRRKMKKAKRLFPKQYAAEYINVAPKADPQMIAVCRNKPRSYAFDEKFLQFVEMNTRFHGTPAGKKEVNDFIEEMKSKVPDQYVYTFFETCYVRIRCFTNNAYNPSCVYFLEEDYRRKTIRKSIEYGSMTRAKEVYERDKIVWIEKSSSG